MGSAGAEGTESNCFRTQKNTLKHFCRGAAGCKWYQIVAASTLPS